MSQRQVRHQRRSSQSVFLLPETFAFEDVPAAVAEGGKPADVSEHVARPKMEIARSKLTRVCSHRSATFIDKKYCSYFLHQFMLPDTIREISLCSFCCLLP
jgi:hypothetical protein